MVIIVIYRPQAIRRRYCRSALSRRFSGRKGRDCVDRSGCSRRARRQVPSNGLSRHKRPPPREDLAREGATEQQLKAIGGWKSNVVSHYVHLAAEDAKAVLERMNAKILGNGANREGSAPE